MSKKRILVTSVHMGIGGIETVLIEFLKYLDDLGYEIDLYLLKKSGENYSKIPSSVAIYSPEEFINSKLIRALIKKDNMISKIIRRIFFTSRKVYKYIPQKKYDVAIAFAGYQTFIDLVAGYSNAKKKYIWVHTDIKWQVINSKTEQSKFLKSKFKYDLFDKIIFVSESCKDSFIEVFNEYKNKCDYVWNLSTKKSDSKNCDNIKLLRDGYNIILVGRIEKQKAFSRIIKINSILLKKNIHVNFYIIGNGSLMNKLNGLIKKSEFNNIYMMGVKTNVNEYMQQADLLLMTSCFEGLPTVLLEALTYSLPFVAPDITGARDIVKYLAPKNSCIMTIETEEALAKGIIDAMNGAVNKNFKFSVDIMNKQTIEKLKKLI